MRIVERESSYQIRDHAGRLVTTFPTRPEATAYLVGYSVALTDALREIDESIGEIRGRPR